MEGGELSSEAVQSSNWEVYKDAFAPQPTGRRVKAWERAPVHAHAPRLHGHKIWKKAGIRSQSGMKSNDAAQQELETEGMGARKKQRVIGGKENIGDAPWLSTSHQDENLELVNGILSPKKNSRLLLAGGDADALLVPRKRTNANHIITPRKHSTKIPLQDLELHAAGSGTRSTTTHTVKSIPLNEDANSPAPAEKPLRRRKSLRKSSRRLTLMDMAEEAVPTSFDHLPGPSQASPSASIASSDVHPKSYPEDTSAQVILPSSETSELLAQHSPRASEGNVQKIPLNDQTVQTNTTHGSDEKSTRRKSLRKSTPRLTSGDIPEETVKPVAASALSETDASSSVLTSVEVPGAAQSTPQIAISSAVVVACEISNPEPVREAEESPTSDEMIKAVQELPPSPTKKAILALIAQQVNSERKLEQSSTSNIKETPSTLTEPSLAININDAEVEVEVEAVDEKQTAAEFLNTLEKDALVPEELPVLHPTSPTKPATTPKRMGSEISKAGKKTPQPRATRRSTRTRGSSVPLEEHTTEDEIPALASQAEDKARRGSPSKLIAPQSTLIEIAESEVLEPCLANVASAQAEENATRADLPASDAVSSLVQEPEDQVENKANPSIEVSHDEGNGSSDPAALLDHEEGDVKSTGTVVINKESSGSSLVGVETTIDSDSRNDIAEVHTENDNLVELATNVDAETSGSDSLSNLILAESIEALEALDSIPISAATSIDEIADEFELSSTTNPATSDLVAESIPENNTATLYDHDDTDMLRNFLTRVKANKAAKAESIAPKRKRSLPHSPLRLPLGSTDENLSPSSPKEKDEFDVSLPVLSPAKRRKRNPSPDHLEEELTQPQSIRRSGRTRLPVKTPVAAPSFIPVRTLGQDGDSTVTLRRNEDKELAALTRVNTRKNKGGSLHPASVLARKMEEKEDPASRQRALKEVFDEKALKQKQGKKGKTVVWAEELVQYQTADGKKGVAFVETLGKEVEKLPAAEEKKGAVKVGMRSKMTLGMAVNGTPAPKRKMRGRS